MCLHEKQGVFEIKAPARTDKNKKKAHHLGVLSLSEVQFSSRLFAATYAPTGANNAKTIGTAADGNAGKSQS